MSSSIHYHHRHLFTITIIIVDFMAWGWTDSYRPSHLHSSPSHALHDKIAVGISEGIFTADSRELNILPIAPAQAG
jgi:hypothetical protein